MRQANHAHHAKEGSASFRRVHAPNRTGHAPSAIHRLHRTIGNQAVTQLFESGAIQAKLYVNQPGDPHEIEADRVAERVVSAPLPRAAEVHQRRASRSTTASVGDGLNALTNQLGSGRPLDAAERESMEAQFGHEFGDVRLHNDGPGESAAAALNARAFTLGRHVVFGGGEYQPHTQKGKKLLAHELAHVVQQSGGASKTHAGPALSAATGGRIQRQGLTDLFTGGAAVIASGASRLLADPRNKQFANDLLASVKEAPQHAAEILVGEVWEAIKAHWVKFLAVTLGLMAAETVIGILTGVPEPTLLTKVVAVILQLLVIAIVGYFAAVELVGVYEEGRNWLTQAREANGDPAKISEASRSFLRMVRHIILAILALAGVRAKIRGFSVPAGAAAEAGAAGGGSSVDVPDTAGPTPSGPPNLRVIEGGDGGAGPPIASRGGSAFDGAAARQLAPASTPVLRPAPPLPAEAARPAPAPAPATGPLAGRAAAPAAGVAAATQQKKDDKPGEEILHRSPAGRESVNRLATKSAEAEREPTIGIHGVSAFTEPMPFPHSKAPRKDVEAHFPVHNTNGPTHRTIELPKPVTQLVADLFNKIFGRT